MKLVDYKIDTDRAADGVEVVLEDFENLHILIAKWGNTKFLNLFQSLTKRHERKMSRGKLDFEIQQEIMNEVIAKTVWLGVDGLIGEDGKEFGKTWEERKEVLYLIPDLRERIIEEAQDEENYRAASLEVIEKNSGKRSVGK